jgi:N-acetylglucosaminyldiphosphoundecaprenol N-acetyl-beta-D-mannosaminyltransferase
MNRNISRSLTMFDLRFSAVTLSQATEEVIGLIGLGRRELVVTPNVDHVVSMVHDTEMGIVFREARYRFADGMPLVWLSRLRYREGLPKRVTGADLLFSVSAGAAALAADKLQAGAPGLEVSGVYSPPFGFEHDERVSRDIVEMINATQPNILFIGVGTPKQEKWAYRWRSELQCDVILGVGAAFDFAAGTARRAPRFVQQSGLEWLWRMMNDPVRLIPRYIFKDYKFLGLAVRELAKGVRGSRTDG